MSKRKRLDPHQNDQGHIRLFGRHFPVIGRLQVRRRAYLLLDRLSTSDRERFLAFDPYAGLRGSPVAILDRKSVV